MSSTRHRPPGAGVRVRRGRVSDAGWAAGHASVRRRHDALSPRTPGTSGASARWRVRRMRGSVDHFRYACLQVYARTALDPVTAAQSVGRQGETTLLPADMRLAVRIGE